MVVVKALHTPTATEFHDKRIKANLSQADAAEILSVHTNSIKNWEHGRAGCSPATWAFFCNKLEERQQHLRTIVAELNRKLRSRAFRNEFLRKAKG